MDGIKFIQLLISSNLLIISVAYFHIIGIEINFITTLLLTVFTIGISIFFYSESNKTSQIIRDLISGLDSKMDQIQEQTRGIDINMSDDLLKQNQVKTGFSHGRS